jgi:3-oxoacid CoA-transferase
MDLAVGNTMLLIITEHQGKNGEPKLVKECTYPLTGQECVDIVVTDLAVLRRRDDQFVLEAVAPGFTPEEVLELTAMNVVLPENIETMNIASA